MGIPQPSRFVRFGPFQLDLRAAELRRNGIKVRLPDQSTKVLTLLVLSEPVDNNKSLTVVLNWTAGLKP